jgi:CRISPR-associated endonuclease Csn1
MSYRLALDVGTASIGLVAYELNDVQEPISILHHAVRIFPEPLQAVKNESVGQPKKAARREARQLRRQIERKARRLRRIAHCLPLLGLEPETILPDSGDNIHRLRAEAATQRIELADFARVLLKLAKRRGCAGGFRVKKEGEEEGQVQAGISRLKAEMRAGETLGQYLNRRHERGETLKLKEAGLYADRPLLEEEFECLWATQAQFHPVLNEHRDGQPIRAIFHEAIFFQRPLKSPAPMVGNCQLEPDLPRAPMAQPAAQAFRIEKQLADLRWGMGRRPEKLSVEQKAVIRGLLRDRDNVPFETIYKALEKAGCSKPVGRSLNLDRASRDELRGDRTRAALRSKKFNLLDDWDRLSELTQRQIINFVADLGSPDQVDRDDWPGQFKTAGGQPRRFSPELVGFINRWVETGQFDRLGKMGFDAGRSSYSVKALEKLTALMRDRGLDEYEAIREAYPRHHAEKDLQTDLPPPPETGNTVVDVALRQLEREIRKAMKALGGPPAETIVELAREMALGITRRGEIEQENDRNRRRRLKAAEELQRHGYPATRANIGKYLLWEEQEKQHCPYCARAICLSDIADGQATQFEHILPHSLTRVGRKRDQLVLAHAECNHAKGDRTPWQAFGGEPPVQPDRWQAVLAQAERFRKKKLHGKARLLTLKDWEKDVLNEKTVQDFSDRQFQETSWIAKLTAQWLRTVCSKVYVSRGEMTAHLRRIWRLETVIPEVRFDDGLPVFDTDGRRVSQEEFERHKAFWEGRDELARAERTDRRIDKRRDHRHHLIDALVIGLSSPALYRRMAEEYKQRAEHLEPGRRPRLTLAVEPPIKGLRDKALELVKHCNLSHKPDRYPDGPLFKETAYGVAEVSGDGRTIRLRLKPEELRREKRDSEAKRFLTLRKRLAELADDKTSPEAVRKKLIDIASPEVKRIVVAEFERRIAEGQSARQALAAPMVHPQYGTPIKAVKMLHGNAEDSHAVIHRSRQAEHYKLLQHEGYAYLEISPEGKPALVHPREALSMKGRKPSIETIRFYKNDTVLDTSNNKVYVVRQIRAQGGGMLVLSQATEAREVRDMSSAEGLRKLSGRALLRLKVV